jgi:hypothetical protein
MKPRFLVSSLLTLACLAMFWGLLAQRLQLVGLRAEQHRVPDARPNQIETSTNAPTNDTAPEISAPALTVTPELLRLRSEVTRLTERRRELVSVATENQRLLAQLASRGSNGGAGMKPPPGYVRKSEAQFVGYATPENTLQSFLWALRNHDLTNFSQALAPDVAQELQSGRSPEAFFDQANGLVGLGIVGRRELDDGTVETEVEMIPGLPREHIRFRQINGQWKIAGPF